MSHSPGKSSQARLSHFFTSQNAGSSKKPGKRALSPIDLTADEDERGPPSKRAKKAGADHGVTSKTAARPAVSEATRRSIRSKLMQDSHLQLLRRNRDENYLALEAEGELAEEDQEDQEEEPEVIASDDDGGFKDLISGFASKKGRSKSKAAAVAKVRKKAEVLGPSGKAYTPLEKQVCSIITLKRLC